MMWDVVVACVFGGWMTIQAVASIAWIVDWLAGLANNTHTRRLPQLDRCWVDRSIEPSLSINPQSNPHPRHRHAIQFQFQRHASPALANLTFAFAQPRPHTHIPTQPKPHPPPTPDRQVAQPWCAPSCRSPARRTRKSRWRGACSGRAAWASRGCTSSPSGTSGPRPLGQAAVAAVEVAAAAAGAAGARPRSSGSVSRHCHCCRRRVCKGLNRGGRGLTFVGADIDST